MKILTLKKLFSVRLALGFSGEIAFFLRKYFEVIKAVKAGQKKITTVRFAKYERAPKNVILVHRCKVK